MKRKLIAAALAATLVVTAACTTVPTNTQTPTPSTTAGVPATTSAPATTSVPATTTAPATGQVFTAKLQEANRSGVSGEATVAVQGSNLTVQITATGMVPDQTHAQHIHGFADGRVSTSPPVPAAGSVIDEPQAAKSYGPVLVPLEPFPKADASGRVTYVATVQAVSVVPTIGVLPLEGREVVLHGLMVQGTYQRGVPVATGTLRLVPGAVPPVSPGVGGTGTTSPSTSSGGLGY